METYMFFCKCVHESTLSCMFHVLLHLSTLYPQVAVVIAIVFAVLLYRLAVAGAIYRLVSGISGGPSVSDIVVSISGACIQLVFILIMNRVYEYLATVLNNWGV